MFLYLHVQTESYNTKTTTHCVAWVYLLPPSKGQSLAVLERHGLREPRTQSTVDLRISNESLVLMRVIVDPWSSFCFLEIRSARFLMKILHSDPILPLVPITSGVKDPCSTSMILWLYCLFFSSSWRLNICSVVRFY